jgi:hypothetical protein
MSNQLADVSMMQLGKDNQMVNKSSAQPQPDIITPLVVQIKEVRNLTAHSI